MVNIFEFIENNYRTIEEVGNTIQINMKLFTIPKHHITSVYYL